MTTTQRNPLPWILIFTTALTWQPLAAAEITARLSRSQINLGDTVQLSLEASVDLESPPDLSPLAPDFQIVGHQQSQNVQVLNGQRQTRLTLALQLLPHRSGSLTIPAISFGQDSTPPLALNVLDNRPSGDRLANELPAMMPGMPGMPPSVLSPCQPDPVPPAASPPASPFWPVITIL
ncbi:MAG: BatD family protein, partial [Pseudomonadota bacterium]